MGKKYFIPNLPLFRKYMNGSTKAIMKITKENIIEVDSNEDVKALINSIRKTDFVNDNEVKEFFDTNFPEISKQIIEVPLNLDELKRAFRFIFSELPDEIFEEKNTIELLKKVLNFVFRKKEVRFIILNILNRKLGYKDYYRHPPTVEFYYGMIKLSYNLDTYYATICDAQKVIQRAILKEILFSERNIGRKELNLINRGLNISGNFFVDFQTRLEEILKEIREHKTFIKRTNLIAPDNYNQEEIEATKKINETILDVEVRINKIQEAKKIIEKEIRERKGIINIENAKFIIEIILEFLFG